MFIYSFVSSKCNVMYTYLYWICGNLLNFSYCSLHLMQLLSSERANRNKDQLSVQETVSELQQSLQSEQQAAEGKDLMLVIITCLAAWTFAGVELGHFCEMEEVC